MNTGIRRVVFAWYSPYGGYAATASFHSRARSASSLTSRTHIAWTAAWSRISTAGLARRLYTPTRCVGAPPTQPPATSADPTERVRLSVAEARALSEGAMRGIGYEPEEARILADHVIDAALCGYEYSGLPKLLNVADYPRFKAPRQPMRVLKETSVSVLFDGGNQSGMLGMYFATRAVIERASADGFALVGVNNRWMSGRSALSFAKSPSCGHAVDLSVPIRMHSPSPHK